MCLLCETARKSRLRLAARASAPPRHPPVPPAPPPAVKAIPAG